jgi:hypothetical protein
MEGTLLVWVIIITYVVLHRKKEKQVSKNTIGTMMLILAGTLSLLFPFQLGLDVIIEFVNDTLGSFTRTVVTG